MIRLAIACCAMLIVVPVTTRAAGKTPQAPACVVANGQSSALSCAADITAPATCLPYDLPSADVFFSAPRRVFAHYFDIFPLSMDDLPAAQDYYSQTWLVPLKANMWYANGGFLRSRPLPTTPSSAATYQVANFETEVRAAIARGITGFMYDIGSTKEFAAGGNLLNMLTAAAAVDARFSIALMVDHLNIADVETVVKTLYANPSVYRVSNKVVVAPYMADSLPPAAWNQVKSDLANQGMPIYFLPTFLSIPQSILTEYAPVADGMGLFGTALSTEGISESANILNVHQAGKPYMSGISPQGYRPKEFHYWETDASLGYRSGWNAAIVQGADWIQLTTWNDFSETTQVAPYTNQLGYPGTGFYDLTGFYSAWFATQQQPTIRHDVLYYFYRRESVAAAAPNAGQPTVSAPTNVPGADIIELVAFLTKPGTLLITIGTDTVSKAVDAGLQTLTAPLAPGQPQFSLMRDGATRISITGTPMIYGDSGLPNGFTDLTYWSGSGSSVASCSNQ